MQLNSEDYRARDRRCVWHPYTRHSAAAETPFPVMARGEGVYLYDVEGRRYLDAISSWWCCNLGHGHPRVVDAIVRQARELQHSILGNMSHPPAIELAGRLADLFGGEGRRVLFASDGASAVEAALKIALQYWVNLGRPAKRRFASLTDGYHGDTLGAVSVGYVESFHRAFQPVLFDVFRAGSPCCGTCVHGLRPETCGARCFDSMGGILAEHGDELAAVIVEPLCQGAAGMRIYSPEYLRRLAAACAARDVLLIVDEIAMGFGRTGRMFAFEHAAIDPDLVCVGKGLAAGYLPISAAVVKPRIYAAFADGPRDGTFYHGHTFTGNPIACAAALETLRLYEEERIVDRAARLGGVLRERLAPLAACPGVRDVRCLGMIGAVELEARPAAEPSRAQQVRDALLHRGILVRPLGDVVYYMLPLTTPDDVLADAVDALGEALQAIP